MVPVWTTPIEFHGGAESTAFDLDEINDVNTLVSGIGRVYTEEEFWENYRGFLETVVPVAEEAGVKLTLHPINSPVLESMGGIPRLFRNVEAFEKIMELAPSDNHGLKLCLDCFSEMGEDANEGIRCFGECDQIVFIHFRGVVGSIPRFHETFVNEGYFSTAEAVRTLRDVGYDRVLIPDRVPAMVGPDDWRHRPVDSPLGTSMALSILSARNNIQIHIHP